MEKYESKQRQVTKPASMIYNFISDFTIFTPAVQGKVEEWSATPDECSFKVQGMRVGLRIVEREENNYVKIKGGEGVPLDFTFWIQMKEVAECDTRIRMVLHADLNFAIKMMVGKKIQPALDQMVDAIADNLNRV
ncbi:MAG: polyketide cyclase [Rikenellaceae bacterium]|nr:polyketide cyclase [Rikenellaceae bacterium]MBR2333621.1 polyketide cyclase [Rikenellaceae bacterium]MBR2443375.1 polyketide cyclase [Rikenellaceae bacterium]